MSARPATAPDTAGGAGQMPRHVAIIMDGNGRWAKKRHLPRVAGHRQGVEAVRRVTRAARAMGIEALTLYAFSSENWRRPEEEVGDLMGLMRVFIRTDLDELVRENVQLRIIGDYRRFAPDVVSLIEDAVARTAANTGAILVVALNYGAQAEIAAAARYLAEQACDGEMAIQRAIDEAMRSNALDTRRTAAARLADPDLGRSPAVQFFALAGGLCRAAVRRYPVAGFRCRDASRGSGGVRQPPASFRRLVTENSQTKGQSDLAIRSIAGFGMVALAAVAALWFGGLDLLAVVAVVGLLIISEWADHSALARIAEAPGAVRSRRAAGDHGAGTACSRAGISGAGRAPPPSSS